MSLSYHVEHLAWKQRVNQELSRASAFPRPVSSGPSTAVNFQEGYNSALAKSHSQLVPEVHKNSSVNLAYTFGGFTPARHAFKDPKTSSYSIYHGETVSREVDARPASRQKSVGVNTRSEGLYRPKTAVSPQKRYIQELQAQLNEEKKRREEVEKQLKRVKRS